MRITYSASRQHGDDVHFMADGGHHIPTIASDVDVTPFGKANYEHDQGREPTMRGSEP